MRKDINVHSARRNGYEKSFYWKFSLPKSSMTGQAKDRRAVNGQVMVDVAYSASHHRA